MTFGPALRKAVLTVHLLCSLGWTGAVLVYLALGVASLSTADAAAIRGLWSAMALAGWYVIVPLAVASLLSGVFMAIGTPWGLFRHYWVLISFLLTGFSTVILLLHMPSVSREAAAAQEASAASLRSLNGDLVHPALGLVVLVIITVLNVYKPRGITPFGWQQEVSDGTES